MDLLAKESGFTEKALALCQAITEQPDFLALKQSVDAFMSDEGLKFRFQQVNDLGGLLQMKQSEGVELKPDEIETFEKMREELLASPVATGFLDAQQQLQTLHRTIGKYVDKTFELGRPPAYEEVHDGGCGDCGCH